MASLWKVVKIANDWSIPNVILFFPTVFEFVVLSFTPPPTIHDNLAGMSVAFKYFQLLKIDSS